MAANSAQEFSKEVLPGGGLLERLRRPSNSNNGEAQAEAVGTDFMEDQREALEAEKEKRRAETELHKKAKEGRRAKAEKERELDSLQKAGRATAAASLSEGEPVLSKRAQKAIRRQRVAQLVGKKREKEKLAVELGAAVGGLGMEDEAGEL